MSSKRYLQQRSLAAHQSMVSTFILGMKQHWGERDIHVSCDSALARKVAESRLELQPMLEWDAFLGGRQAHELALAPAARHYHRYLPFPRSSRDALDEWAIEKLKISLHHQLLTGVVIYIDPSEITSQELDALESSVVRGRIALFAAGHYWRRGFEVDILAAIQAKNAVEDSFERIWQAQRAPDVMRLFYRFPNTFESAHYFPMDLRKFVLYIQKERCPCSNRCVLSKSWDVDHVIPVSQGGTSVLINLQATCLEYNRQRKRERPEPRPVNFMNIMNDTRWKPRVSQTYQALLLNQSCRPETVSQISALYGRRLHRVA